MLPFDIPPGTTVSSFVTQVVPKAHASLVPRDAPSAEPLVIVVRIEDCASWTLRIRGPVMTVEDGEELPPTERAAMWVYTDARCVEWFLADATGPKRLLPRFPPVSGVATLQ